MIGPPWVSFYAAGASLEVVKRVGMPDRRSTISIDRRFGERARIDWGLSRLHFVLGGV